ncbi:uncharacterized protein LOC120251861 [Dioscorea cayenensis subsp. rotundata]|uniref:Uncharacterized protein LOC120251861 n=1 Tax=Dioscorea cayennensis subsp. rotundata TaxID=55577 RepID=A0AB40AP17_DIOCR|nr:uncharacterized protein LOC120251861 [Dioscorea cayenensis subsp. rotundata]
MVKGEGNEGELSYYGIILDIIELRYTGGNKKLHYLDVTGMILLGKDYIENDKKRKTTNDENVEINLDYSLPSSTRASNEICSSSAPPNKRHRKVNVRGKAKGVKSGEGIEVEIYDNRIITPKAISEIHVLFHQKINGPWTSYSEYPKSELDTLFARYLAVGFSHNQLEEEVKKAFENSVKCRYSDWMLRIRKPIFEKHETREDRYKHPPSFIPSNVWKEMVDKWMGDNWQHKSDKNKN